jgi:hypothetical protein
VAKFIRRGKEKWVFAPSVASKAAPTRSEINAGTVLTVPGGQPTVAGTTGFRFANEPAPLPSMASTFDTSIPGVDTSETPSITLYDDDATTTIRTALAKGAAGFVIRMPYGDVATKRCEVWPVTVAALNDNDATTANEPATFTADFAVTDTPVQTAVIPA